MNRITFVPGLVVLAGAVFTAVTCISMGCNTVLGNEEGIARHVDAGSQIGVEAHPLADGGAAAECDTDAGRKVCFGVCVSTDDAKTGCGGTSCVACDPKNVKGAQCIGGADGFTCAFDQCKAGFDNCDNDKTNGCETSLGTAAACGGCQAKCGAEAPFCTAGNGGAYHCVAECPPGTTTCAGAGACVDIKTSADNCGGCGNKCDRASATATCQDEHCVYTCAAGFHDCNDACVADIDTDHCGSTCTKCSADPSIHVDATCISGGCGVTCSDGWFNCDDDKSNGCEHQGKCPVVGSTSGVSSGGTTSGSPCGCTTGGVDELALHPLIICPDLCAATTE